MPDYAGAPGRTGWAVGLDVPASILALLGDLRAAGYRVEGAPEDERALLDALSIQASTLILRCPSASRASKDARLARAGRASFEARCARHLRMRWFFRSKTISASSPRFPPPHAPRSTPPGAIPPPTRTPSDGAFHFRAAWFGNILVAIAPDRGRHENRRADYHDPALPPRHALVAFGLWLRHVAKADALVHMGAHGTLEWLPGKHVALTSACFPELVLGALPVIYPFIVSNPGEAAQAKRRIAAVTLGHLPPPLIEGGLSGDARELERLLDEYAQADGLDRRRRERLATLIVEEAERTGLAREAGVGGDADEALKRIDAWLCDVKELRLKDGFHIYGRGACGEAERDALLAALDGAARRRRAGRRAGARAHRRAADRAQPLHLGSAHAADADRLRSRPPRCGGGGPRLCAGPWRLAALAGARSLGQRVACAPAARRSRRASP